MTPSFIIAPMCGAALAVIPGCSDTAEPEPSDQPSYFSQTGDGCDPNYAGGCVPNTPHDLDCADSGSWSKWSGPIRTDFTR
jgi:hypothetical protein